MPRVWLPKALQLQVFYRDSWHCRYCQRPLFFSPTFKLFEQGSPGHSYYHANGKTGHMLPLLQWRFASVDHVIPVGASGTNEIENLVAACWRCNLDKSDDVSGTIQPRSVPGELSELNWDGFASLYVQLPGSDPAWVAALRDHVT
jgi:hypothetical protein